MADLTGGWCRQAFVVVIKWVQGVCEAENGTMENGWIGTCQTKPKLAHDVATSIKLLPKFSPTNSDAGHNNGYKPHSVVVREHIFRMATRAGAV